MKKVPQSERQVLKAAYLQRLQELLTADELHAYYRVKADRLTPEIRTKVSQDDELRSILHRLSTARE